MSSSSTGKGPMSGAREEWLALRAHYDSLNRPTEIDRVLGRVFQVIGVERFFVEVARWLQRNEDR
jgi:hypothetical protein